MGRLERKLKRKSMGPYYEEHGLKIIGHPWNVDIYQKKGNNIMFINKWKHFFIF
jgi:hypothetical protein